MEQLNIMASISCEYTLNSTSELLNEENTFAVFSFTGDTQLTSDPRHINTGLQQLASSDISEVWRSDLPISKGSSNGINWSCNGDLILCSIQIDESNSDDLCLKTEQAYTALLQLIANKGLPHIIRAWNYLPNITAGKGDAERYKQFCLGRHIAFEKHPELHEYPAACALGHHSDNTVIYILASATPGAHIENPKQISAFDYPRQYGPRGPSFARATLADAHIYISGTASIRGHETFHSDSLSSQLALTFDNIDELLKHSQQLHQLPSTPTTNLLKVYIRHTDDVATIQSSVEKHFSGTSILYVQADICRQELQVEIDGLCKN